jgi:hypothetical protein
VDYPTFDACEVEAGKSVPSAAPDVVDFVRSRLGIEPDARQAEALRSEAKRGILNCSRQWGKSTMAAAKAVHRAFTRKQSLVLVASPTDRQSAELVTKAADMAARLGIRRRGDGHNAASLVFPNGSRIVGLPGMEHTVRGFSGVSLLLIDEASRVPDRIYKALLPVLARSGGDLWLMSTPWFKTGFFYEAWTHGGPDWMRMRVPATECAWISKEYLEEQRVDLGPIWFPRDFMCEFVDSGAGVFERELIEAAIDYSIEPLDVDGGKKR